MMRLARRHRRGLALGLMAVGALLLFLAPQNAWIGAVLGALGLAIELAAFAIAHRAGRRARGPLQRDRRD